MHTVPWKHCPTSSQTVSTIPHFFLWKFPYFIAIFHLHKHTFLYLEVHTGSWKQCSMLSPAVSTTAELTSATSFPHFRVPLSGHGIWAPYQYHVTIPYHVILYHTIPSYQSYPWVSGVLFQNIYITSAGCRLQYWSIGCHFLWKGSSCFSWDI